MSSLNQPCLVADLYEIKESAEAANFVSDWYAKKLGTVNLDGKSSTLNLTTAWKNNAHLDKDERRSIISRRNDAMSFMTLVEHVATADELTVMKGAEPSTASHLADFLITRRTTISNVVDRILKVYLPAHEYKDPSIKQRAGAIKATVTSLNSRWKKIGYKRVPVEEPLVSVPQASVSAAVAAVAVVTQTSSSSSSSSLPPSAGSMAQSIMSAVSNLLTNKKVSSEGNKKRKTQETE